MKYNIRYVSYTWIAFIKLFIISHAFEYPLCTNTLLTWGKCVKMKCSKESAFMEFRLDLLNLTESKDFSSIDFSLSDEDCTATLKKSQSVPYIVFISAPYISCGSGFQLVDDKLVYSFKQNLTYSVNRQSNVYHLDYKCVFDRGSQFYESLYDKYKAIAFSSIAGSGFVSGKATLKTDRWVSENTESTTEVDERSAKKTTSFLTQDGSKETTGVSEVYERTPLTMADITKGTKTLSKATVTLSGTTDQNKIILTTQNKNDLFSFTNKAINFVFTLLPPELFTTATSENMFFSETTNPSKDSEITTDEISVLRSTKPNKLNEQSKKSETTFTSLLATTSAYDGRTDERESTPATGQLVTKLPVQSEKTSFKAETTSQTTISMANLQGGAFTSDKATTISTELNANETVKPAEHFKGTTAENHYFNKSTIPSTGNKFKNATKAYLASSEKAEEDMSSVASTLMQNVLATVPQIQVSEMETTPAEKFGSGELFTSPAPSIFSSLPTSIFHGGCISNPCRNGGKCYHVNQCVLCTCPKRHAGLYCEELIVPFPGIFRLVLSGNISRLFALFPESASLYRNVDNITVELVHDGHYYGIRSLSGCPTKRECLSWLRAMDDGNVMFYNSQSYYPWTLTIASFSSQTYHLRSSMTGQFLSYKEGYFLFEDIADSVTISMLDVEEKNPRVLEAENYISYVVYEIYRLWPVQEDTYISIPVNNFERTNKFGFTTCFWYKTLSNSEVSIPTLGLSLRLMKGFRIEELPGDFFGLKKLRLIGSGSPEIGISPNYKDISRGFWHFLCLSVIGSKFTLYIDGFNLVNASLDDAGLKWEEQHSVEVAYCSKTSIRSCFSGIIHGINVWGRILSTREIHSVFTATTACGLHHADVKCSSNKDFEQLEIKPKGCNVKLRKASFPECSCKFCQSGWSLSSPSCFQVTSAYHDWRSYLHGRLCNSSRPAMTYRHTDDAVVSSMTDATYDGSFPYVARKFMSKRKKHIWNGNVKMNSNSTSPQLCAVYHPERVLSSFIEDWPSRVPGSISRPRNFTVKEANCSLKRPVVCQKDAAFLSPATSTKILYVLNYIRPRIAFQRYKDALFHLIGMLKYTSFEVCFLSLNVNDLRCHSAHSLVTKKIEDYFSLDKHEYEKVLQRFNHAHSQLAMDFRYVVLTPSLLGGLEEVDALKLSLDGKGSIFVLGTLNANLRYSQTLATHPSFAYYLDLDRWLSDIEKQRLISNFRRFLCGVKQSKKIYPLPPLPQSTTSANTTFAPSTPASTSSCYDKLCNNNGTWVKIGESYVCKCASRFKGLNCEERIPSLQCEKYAVVVEVDQTTVLGQGRPTSANSTEVYFKNHKNNSICRTRVPIMHKDGYFVYRLSIPFPFTSCGMHLEFHSNQLQVCGSIYKDDQTVSPVPVAWFSCVCKREGSITVPNRPEVEISNHLPEVVGLGFFKIDLQLFLDASLRFKVKTCSKALAPRLSYGQRVHALITPSDSLPPSICISIVYCFASPDLVYDPYSSHKVPLIQKSCVEANPKLSLRIEQSNRTIFHFSFTVFRWKDLSQKFIHIHCGASLCYRGNPKCVSKCSSKRNARSIEGDIYHVSTSVASVKLAQDIQKPENERRAEESKDEIPPDGRKETTTSGPRGAHEHDYLMAGLLFFTFLFFIVIILVILHTTRGQSMKECVKHTSSRYYRGLSFSDITSITSKLERAADVRRTCTPPNSEQEDFVACTSSSRVNPALKKVTVDDRGSPLIEQLKKRQAERPNKTLMPRKQRKPFITFLGGSESDTMTENVKQPNNNKGHALKKQKISPKRTYSQEARSSELRRSQELAIFLENISTAETAL